MIDPDWRPASEQVVWVRQRYAARDAQIAEQAEKFRDYHSAKGTVSKDWAASWRTWWGNGFHKIPKRQQPDVPPVFAVHPDTDEGRQAYLDQLKAAGSWDP